mmetsp:Transcript_29630/g.74361  ORF Transcript_29630/g.74361 Transcript_29630/m.74361 type:complete len:152 (-) Transcript_29630:531-986(-)
MDGPIRSNLVIACGDLFVRFPNSLEPWTGHLYQVLGDPDVRVRKNAVMVITHLILNDMMKVKGHIAAMAICLEVCTQMPGPATGRLTAAAPQTTTVVRCFATTWLICLGVFFRTTQTASATSRVSSSTSSPARVSRTATPCSRCCRTSCPA